MLHIRCGDDIIKKIMNARLPGRAITWAEPLCDGPVTDTVLHNVLDQRLDFITHRYGLKPKFVKKGLEKQDKTLQTAERHEEIVLWIEADLYDQMIMVYLVEQLKQICPEETKISVICRYVQKGFGSLEAPQLAKMFETRHLLSAEDIALLNKVWCAYTSSDPSVLSNLLETETFPELFKHLKSGLERHLEDVFWTTDGLSKTERYVLECVNAGTVSPIEIYKQWSEVEGSAWLPDALFFAYIFEMISAANPLLSSNQARKAEELKLNLTENGKKVLSGELHRKELWKDMDRYRGGLHIADETGMNFLWNPEKKAVIAA